MNKKKILIIEDEAIISLNIKTILIQKGYEVCDIGRTAVAAVELFEKHNPDLIIMDIFLKGEKDGISAVEEIKEKHDIPIVYLTAHSDEKTLERAKKTEPHGYIVKPISHDDLHATIEIAFYKHAMDKKLREMNEELITANKELKAALEELESTSEELKQSNEEFQAQNEELIEAQQSLAESEERWHFALDGSRDGVWDWNAEINEVFFSRRWKEMLGYEEDEISNSLDEWDKRIHPDDKEKCYADLKRHFDGETPFYENEHRVLCKDGLYKWIRDRGKVISWTEDNKPLRVIGTHMDITDRRKAEEKVISFANILEDSLNEIYIFNAETLKFIQVNRGARENLGYSMDKLSELTPLDIKPLFTPEQFQEIIDQIRKDRKIKRFETVHKRKDGSLYPVEIHLQFSTLGVNPVFVAIILDITERKRAEEALNDSNETLQRALDNIDAIVYIACLDTYKILYLNKYAHSFFGDSVGELCYEALQQGQSGPCDFCTNDKLVDDTGKPTDGYNWEFQHTTNKRWYAISDRAIKWIDGRIVRLEIAYDITERKIIEDNTKSLLTEKETLLKEIHHRVKNNMQTISSIISLQSFNVKDENARLQFDECQNRINSMALVHEKLYKSESLSNINFNEYLKTLIDGIYQSYGKSTAEIPVILNAKDIHLDVDRAMPCSLIINELVSNIFKYAFPEGKKGKIKIDFKMNKNGNYTLIVNDNGIGLHDDTNIENLPSLGMRLVNALVRQLNGEMKVSGNNGTKVTISFS